MISSIVFSILYLYICNWSQINSYILSLKRGKMGKSVLQNKSLLSLIERKSGVSLENITLFHDSRPFGMMAYSFTFPPRPEMILSKGLYEGFNKDELEWVILHEAGHQVKMHFIKAGLVELIGVILGAFLASKVSLIFIPLLALLLAVLSIRVFKYFEYEADSFSIDRVDNPNGVISAQSKFRKAYNNNWFYNQEGFMRRFFHWNIFPSERIQMAKLRLMK